MPVNNLPSLQNPFIHPNATVFGMYELGTSVSIWPGVVIRADMNWIKLGNYVNIQDNSTLHTDSSSPISIGDWTLVGHNAMIHGAKIGKGVLIGIGSIVLDNAEIGDGSQIAAGCLVRGKKKIPPRSLVVPGAGDIIVYPGKANPIYTVAGCLEYIHLANRYLNQIFKPFTPAEEAEFKEQAKSIVKDLGI